ncbi:MAG: four-carbon acid sugar kinase family protein [Clostridia bacterium]|jgi:uncharacterized protein YgbK (DUF1537 family)|nr:four-carbon acid sugar kinase family protein [Clostridia bacterium]MCI2015901.1 four-carbon acid sugar kinase family protein [Clostridia bacterium]
MHKCVVIADDLTGGNATGVMISGYGYDTYSIVNKDGLNLDDMPECDCIVYPTNSRALPAKEAYDLVYEATKFFKDDSIKVYSKRIDSTLRGNLGSETDAMLDALDNDAVAMVVPCFPQAERITVGGYVLVKGIPLHKTEAAADPIASIDTPLPVNLFKKQSKYDIGSIMIDDMMYGEEYIADKIKIFKQEGKRIIVFDSLTQEDMDLIANAIIKSGVNFIAVDPGIFTATMVSRLVPNAKKEQRTNRVLAVVGTTNAVARGQLEEFLETQPGALNVYAETEEFLRSEERREKEITRVVNEVLYKCHGYDMCTVVGDGIFPAKRISFKTYMEYYNINADGVSKMINDAFAEITEKILRGEKTFQGLYTSGGDITIAVCKRLKVAGLKLIEDVAPLAAHGIMMSGEFNGLKIVTKGGMVGDKYAMKVCMNYLSRKINS